MHRMHPVPQYPDAAGLQEPAEMVPRPDEEAIFMPVIRMQHLLRNDVYKVAQGPHVG